MHAAVHLFQDSDLTGRLRDLVDIDMFARAHGVVAGFWGRLVERGVRHGATRALWYALGGARSLLGAPIPAAALDALEPARPAQATRTLMQRLVPLALLPNDPDRLPRLDERAARGALLVRYHWLRMPPGLLARHTIAKALRSLRERKPIPVDA